MPKLHLITYGCQMNEYDSERVAGLLKRESYELTLVAEEADLILLNTCAIREKAEDKVFSRLGQLRTLKQQRPEEKPAVAETEEEPAPALQPIEELTPDSDFTPFMNPKVDAATRRAALKKLFADAHFNVPDPYEAYSEDWTVGEKIPMEMLKTLNHAQKLLFDEVEKTAQAPVEKTDAVQPEAKDVAGKQDA